MECAALRWHVIPKASVFNELKPLAYVDDDLLYLAGIDSKIHLALNMRVI